jgi:hypothetical protein
MMRKCSPSESPKLTFSDCDRCGRQGALNTRVFHFLCAARLARFPPAPDIEIGLVDGLWLSEDASFLRFEFLVGQYTFAAQLC